MSLDVYLRVNKCPCCGRSDAGFEANITHNLNIMATEAGIYSHVWRPEEVGVTKASQLIEPLRKAIAEMKADPERFKKHNPENGWGNYDAFVPWLERYLAACEETPDASVEVRR
ncbi:MAG: hypothetical protein BWY66_00565 [bacterium ADurb.Bin374]|nr:MAG: hypothetical protein BWY66_00565 [bacterium ADurb.Bin374]